MVAFKYLIGQKYVKKLKCDCVRFEAKEENEDFKGGIGLKAIN